MLRKFVLLVIMLLPLPVAAQLPDFTELVEKQGPTVVNISTTQTVRNPLGIPQIPQLQEDDPFYALADHAGGGETLDNPEIDRLLYGP